jgi:hypothetical protein
VLVRIQFWAPLHPDSIHTFRIRIFAEVVELVDTHVSGACVARCAGSSPAFGTQIEPAKRWLYFFLWLLLFMASVYTLFSKSLTGFIRAVVTTLVIELTNISTRTLAKVLSAKTDD